MYFIINWFVIFGVDIIDKDIKCFNKGYIRIRVRKFRVMIY